MASRPAGLRPAGGRNGFRQARRGRWAWRCALFGGVGALGAGGGLTLARTSLAFVGPVVAGPRHTASGRQASVEDVQSKVEDAIGNVKQAATDVIETPSRMQKEAQAAVDKTIDNFQRDDGRILDTETPAGFVGALAVSLAILPYLPVSFYSTYLLSTTGKGIPAGPNGLFGLAEGISTLVVFLVVFWSTISFFTRARGLPSGPLNLLGVTQTLSFFAAIALAGTSYFKGSSPSVLASLKQVKLPPLPAVSLPANLPGPDMSKISLPALEGLGKDSSDFVGGLQKGISEKVAEVKDTVKGKVEGISAKVADVKGKVADVKDQVKDAAKDAAKEVKGAVQEVKGAVQEAKQSVKESVQKAAPAGKDVSYEDLF